MVYGSMKRFTTESVMFSDIISCKPTLMVTKDIVGRYKTNSLYTISNGSGVTVLVGNEWDGYKPLIEFLQEEIIMTYGLLNG